jgi:hypothetical protein
MRDDAIIRYIQNELKSNKQKREDLTGLAGRRRLLDTFGYASFSRLLHGE